MTNASMYEPRSPRFGIHHDSTLVRADGTELPVVIVNISHSGFRLKMGETPLIGEKVLLRGEVGDVPAQIRWALGDTAGGYFLRPSDD
jgi:hypothetical protein